MGLLGLVSAATAEKTVHTHYSYGVGDYDELSVPSADESKVVWAVNNVWDDSTLYYRDLHTKSPEKVISKNSKDKDNPDISGKYLVWEEEVDFNRNLIYFKDLTSTAKPKAVNSNSNKQYNPRISGTNIVWIEKIGSGTNTQHKIMGYNISTKKLFLIARFWGDKKIPSLGDIDKNYVVYAAPTNTDPQQPLYNIWIYNTLNGSTKNIATNIPIRTTKWFNLPLKISGDNIVWFEDVGTNTVIKNYKITTQTTSTPLTGLYKVENLAIHNTFVTWQTYKYTAWAYGFHGFGELADYYDIYMSDISKKNPIREVCTNKDFQRNPQIGGSYKLGVYVYWMDFRNNYKVYWRNMDPNPPWIKSTYPRHGQTGFSRTAPILVKMNKYISPSINFNKITLKNQSNNHYVPITKYVKNDTIYIITKDPRWPKTRYQLIIPAKSVKDNALNLLVRTKTIIFRTGA